MADDFRDLLRDEADAGLRRFSDENFADEFGSRVVGRVKRRRAVTATAVGGGSVLAIGALVVGAMQLSWGARTPVGGPSDCVTPSHEGPGTSYPWTTVAADGTGYYGLSTVRLSGPVTLGFMFDTEGALTVTFADGSSTVATDIGRSVAGPLPLGGAEPTYVFFLPDGSPAIAVRDSAGDLEVSVGDPGATYGNSGPDGSFAIVPPTMVGEGCVQPTPVAQRPTALPTPLPTSEQVSKPSPFTCGFDLAAAPPKDNGLVIDQAKWVDREATIAALKGQYAGLPFDRVSAGSAQIPRVRVTDSNSVGFRSWTISAEDPAMTLAHATGGDIGSGPSYVLATTFVEVTDGLVVGWINPHDGSAGALGLFVGQPAQPDGAWTAYLLAGEQVIHACPGVDSLDGSTLYAIAGSGSVAPDGTTDGPRYTWIEMPSP